MKHQPSSRHERASGFTLVEMLVVMAIALTLIGITVSALRGMNSTSSRKAAVGTLMGVFDQARAIAISEGRPTYVVFASNPRLQSANSGLTAALPATTWGRGYALYQDQELKDTDTATSTVQRSSWMHLPVGVAFKADSSDGTPPAVTDAVLDTKTFSVVSRASNSSQPVLLTLPYVKFDNTGMIVNASGELVDPSSACLRVLLFEGTADSSGREVYTRRSAASDNKKYALDEILLKPTTGRARYTIDPINNTTLASN